MTTNRPLLYDIMEIVDMFEMINLYLFFGDFCEFLGAENYQYENYKLSDGRKNRIYIYIIFIYILEFSSQKTIYLNISGIYLLFWALSRPLGIFFSIF